MTIPWNLNNNNNPSFDISMSCMQVMMLKDNKRDNCGFRRRRPFDVYFIDSLFLHKILVNVYAL